MSGRVGVGVLLVLICVRVRCVRVCCACGGCKLVLASGPHIQVTCEKHPGVLVAKVGYFGVKSAKVCRAQMGTKPAKVGRLGPRYTPHHRDLGPSRGCQTPENVV